MTTGEEGMIKGRPFFCFQQGGGGGAIKKKHYYTTNPAEKIVQREL